MPSPTPRLVVASTPGQKTVAVTLCAVFCALLVPFFTDTGPAGLSGGPVLPFLVVVVLGQAYTVIKVLRHRVRLLGTRLESTGVIKRNSADLATADVWFGWQPDPLVQESRRERGFGRVPYIVAQDQGGPRVRLPLRVQHEPMAPQELRMLAAAIESGRRSDPESEQVAAETAARLRQMAEER